MVNQYNPFKENRTEQMSDLWKYYVPFPGLDGAVKPLVVQGGRGSGKTMFFQCNSWREVLSQIRKKDRSVTELFDNYEFVGVYYRVDTTFVSSMRDRTKDYWGPVFETYLGICVVKEILDFLTELFYEMIIDESDILNFVTTFARRFNPHSTVENLSSFKLEIETYLDIIEDYINGTENSTGINLRLVNAHRIISDICMACVNILKRKIIFKIFIDEYETLQEYQQRIVNTLIKHSSLPVIFNIGLRPKGMKTNCTISETETIEAPHDFELLTLSIDSDEYQDILKKICQKRIALGKEKGKIPESASENIDFYLGLYSFDDELTKLTSSVSELPYMKKLRHIIEQMGTEQELTKDIILRITRDLCDTAPIINSRLHYTILCKKTSYTPTLEALHEAYITNSKRYSDWMHNRKFGLLFSICKEFKKDKLYYGFDVFAALSSHIVRYFLELCEQTFKIAFLENFTWESPIEPEIQTEAARYVSEYKIVDIAGYEPFGKELRIFIQYLGQIFYRLHTSEFNTLGEPEPNHFNTKDLSLTSKSKTILDSGIMWNVLLEGEPTKRKQSKLSPETVDYYMNKIYTPYFGISYRNKRKILLDIDVLEKLLSGDEGDAKAGFRSFFNIQSDQPFTSENSTHQISFFDFDQGG